MKAIYGVRTCAVCAGPYTNSHARHVCCSLECGHELRRRNMIAALEARLGESVQIAIKRRIESGLSMRAITAEFGMSDVRALGRLMDRVGIPRPTRSEAVRKQWVDAPERRARQAAFLGEYVRADPERARANSIKANLKLQTTSPTSIERALMTALDGAGIAYEFQYVVGGKFLCDFAFTEARLIVETDGSYWHRTERQKKQDASKDAYLQACGYTVLRLTDVQVTQHLSSSLLQIQALLDR